MAVGSDNVWPKLIVAEGVTPASPSAGQQKLFIDSADHKLKRVNSAGSVTTIEGGGGGSGSSGFTQLRKSATQSIPGNAATVLTWDVEDYDTLGLHDNVTNNTRLTATQAGVLKVSAHIGFTGGGGQQYLSFYVNGVQKMGWAVGNAVSPNVLSLTREFAVAAGDYVETYFYTGSGTVTIYKDMSGVIAGSILTARMVGTV